MQRVERGQSEVAGALLLVAVVVVAVSAASVVYLPARASADVPPVELRATANATHVTVVHRGGEPLPLSSLRVVVAGESGRATLTFGGSDGRLEPGEALVRAHGLALEPGDRVEVLVVHRPTDALLLEADRVV